MLMLGADTFVAVGLDFGCCAKVTVGVEHVALTDVIDGLMFSPCSFKFSVVLGPLPCFALSGSV